MDNLDSWGAPSDGLAPYASLSRSDPIVVKSEVEGDDDTFDKAATRDAYEASFGVGPTEFHESVEGTLITNQEAVHPWFEYLT